MFRKEQSGGLTGLPSPVREPILRLFCFIPSPKRRFVSIHFQKMYKKIQHPFGMNGCCILYSSNFNILKEYRILSKNIDRHIVVKFIPSTSDQFHASGLRDLLQPRRDGAVGEQYVHGLERGYPDHGLPPDLRTACRKQHFVCIAHHALRHAHVRRMVIKQMAVRLADAPGARDHVIALKTVDEFDCAFPHKAVAALAHIARSEDHLEVGLLVQGEPPPRCW